MQPILSILNKLELVQVPSEDRVAISQSRLYRQNDCTFYVNFVTLVLFYAFQNLKVLAGTYCDSSMSTGRPFLCINQAGTQRPAESQVSELAGVH